MCLTGFGNFSSIYGHGYAFAPDVMGFIVVGKWESADFVNNCASGVHSFVKCAGVGRRCHVYMGAEVAEVVGDLDF